MPNHRRISTRTSVHAARAQLGLPRCNGANALLAIFPEREAQRPFLGEQARRASQAFFIAHGIDKDAS